MDRREFLGSALGLVPAGMLSSATDEPVVEGSPEEAVFVKYLHNVHGYIQHTDDTDETFMREFEGGIEIPEQGADDFRRMFMAYLGHLYMKDEPITWDCEPRVRKGVLAYLEKQCGCRSID